MARRLMPWVVGLAARLEVRRNRETAGHRRQRLVQPLFGARSRSSRRMTAKAASPAAGRQAGAGDDDFGKVGGRGRGNLQHQALQYADGVRVARPQAACAASIPGVADITRRMALSRTSGWIGFWATPSMPAAR
jgi:hypothetical protein